MGTYCSVCGASFESWDGGFHLGNSAFLHTALGDVEGERDWDTDREAAVELVDGPDVDGDDDGAPR